MADGRAIKITAHSHEPATKGVGCASRESIRTEIRERRARRARVLWSVPSVERCVLRLHVACRCTREAYKAQENQERIYNIYARQPTPPDISPGVGRKACGAIKQRELTVCPRPAVTAPEPRRPRGVFTSTDAAWSEAAAVPSRHLRGTASAASNAGQPRRAPR